MRHWVPKSRIGIDFDLFVSKQEIDILKNKAVNVIEKWGGKKYHIKFEDNSMLEVEVSNTKSSSELFESISVGPIISLWGLDVKVAEPEILFAIKKSHITRPVNWWKHIVDYHKLKQMVHNFSPELTKIVKLRKSEIKTLTDKRRNLNISNDEFFGKTRGINRTYDHDALHRVICFYDKPMHEKLKFDTSVAMIERTLFDNLQHIDKIRTVQEEAFVIALERKVIPAMETCDAIEPLKAFRYAIERICTTLTSGWFREFAIEHVPEIMKYDVGYVDKFNSWRTL